MLSGLLSLNVHEPLTFEGTEICLHPDIFQSSATTIGGGDGSSTVGPSSRQSVSSLTNNGAIPSNINASASSCCSADGSSLTLQQDNRLLQVGDMIEILVWDPLTDQGAKITPISVLRKRHPQSPQLPGNTPYPAGAIASSGEPVIYGLHSPDSSRGTEDQTIDYPRKSPTSSTSRPQDSDLSEIPQAGVLAGDTSQLKQRQPGEPANLEVAETSLPDGDRTPQLSPRHSPSESPSGIPELNAELGNLPAKQLSRPPIVPRWKSTSAIGNFPNATSAATTNKTLIAPRKYTENSAQSWNPGSKGTDSMTRTRTLTSASPARHVRELSDISADTVLSPGGDSRGPSMDIGGKNFNSIDNRGDDENDMLWNEISTTHKLRLSFVMLVTEKSLKSLKASSRTHISILRQVADLYQLSTYDMVTVHKLSAQEAEKALEAVSADFVVVTIKDQYLSRGELHFFQNSLIGSWIYEGQRLFEPTRSIHANAREIRHGGAHARSGIVTDSTTIAFRSRSARILWLVQMSEEMWDFAPPFQASQKDSSCEIYFDRFISFIYGLFTKWKKAEVTHSLTVVFFSRTFLTPVPSVNVNHGAHSQRDIYGRQYEDHCRIVIENETRTDWDSLIVRIKEAFLRYPNEVGWNLTSGPGARRPSTASQGNLLEAVNVTLNQLQYHYLDRDLHRTGNSIVVVSAGNGVFEVDKKLAVISYQRMMDNGIGSDMLSLGLPPLHIAPFFLYFNEFQEVESEIPHWIHLSFISYESDENLVALNISGTEESEEGASVGGFNEPYLEIGPNGFLRSRKIPTQNIPRSFEGSVDGSKKALVPRGNAAAASKGKRRNNFKKREDRDFRDILEACRPRGTGLLPRPVKSLIEMYAAGEKKEKTGAGLSDFDGFDITIKEWDEVALEEVNRGKPKLFASEASSPLTSPLVTSLSPPRIYELDHFENTPPKCPSFSTQASQTLLGTSYERHLLAVDASNLTNVLSMQRAPSLTFPGTNETSTSDAVVIGSQKNEEDESYFIDLMRRHMQNYDRNIMQVLPDSPRTNPKPDIDRGAYDSQRLSQTPSRPKFVPLSRGQPASFGRDSLAQAPIRSSISGSANPLTGPTAGGIGAALSQYSGTISSTEGFEAEGPGTIPRTFSTGRIGPPLLMKSDKAPYGLSPLVLPPSRVLNSAVGESPFVLSLGLQERRLIPSQDLSRPTEVRNTNNAGLASSLESKVFKVRARIGSGGQHREMENVNSDSKGSSLRSVAVGQQVDAESGQDPRSTKTRQRGVSGVQQPVGRQKPPSSLTRPSSKEPSSNLATRQNTTTTRRRKPINPFRQQDEIEVLAQKSHNSRRWSHVFPQGEIEFKRKSGPNWKSLTAPAILPLSVDYFPPQREREHKFTFSLYNVTLSEFERNNFSSNKELLWEMVRQRITQDYQFVPASLVDDRDIGRRRPSRRDQMTQDKDGALESAVRMYLSMGHRLQVLHYDPTSDTVEVKTFMAKNAQGNHVGTFNYFYHSFCQDTGEFVRVAQDFRQFTSPYNWNKVDRIICGDEDREMREGMRFKRLMFAILPERHRDLESENVYIEKFKKLLEYFEKLRDKEEKNTPLKVKIESSQDCPNEHGKAGTRVVSKPGIAGSSMVRFYVPFRKGGRELFEYLEVSIDSTFHTSWSYRILFNWFVASSGKVEAHIQLLQRRCNQFGLFLVPSLELSVSKTLFLNPFKAPAIFTIRQSRNVALLDEKLVDLDFIHDGVFLCARDFIDCIDDGAEFDFGKKWGKLPAGRQVIHRTGVLFVRIVEDRNGKAVVFAFGNYRYTLKDSSVSEKRARVFEQLNQCMKELAG